MVVWYGHLNQLVVRLPVCPAFETHEQRWHQKAVGLFFHH